MKLGDAIANVDRSEKNTQPAYAEDFNYALGTQASSYEYRFGDRVKKHWISKWLCTDTWVGLAAYYMDDEPIAVSFQQARKSDQIIQFVSKEAAVKLRDFILSFEDPIKDVLEVLNPNEDLGDFYTVDYSPQLLAKEGFYQGEKVQVEKIYHDIDNWDNVMIKLPNGESKKILMQDFQIPYSIKE